VEAERTPLDNKVIILNGFSYEEIDKIMRSVKPQFENPRDLIFAKTTPTSLKMTVEDLIEDISEDHEYLKKNPPNLKKKQEPES
jgi:hypothetical protein